MGEGVAPPWMLQLRTVTLRPEGPEGAGRRTSAECTVERAGTPQDGPGAAGARRRAVRPVWPAPGSRVNWSGGAWALIHFKSSSGDSSIRVSPAGREPGDVVCGHSHVFFLPLPWLQSHPRRRSPLSSPQAGESLPTSAPPDVLAVLAADTWRVRVSLLTRGGYESRC